MQSVTKDRKIENITKNKVLLIYNPHSGKGMFKNNLDLIVHKFQERGMLVIPLRADGSVAVEQFLSELDETQYRKIIAAGGDGTINIVVNAMMKNDINLPLALFPAGTANDFAHYFDVPTDIEGMSSIALEDHYMEADLGKCNDRYFVNVAAIGPVVDVSQKTDTAMKNALGIVAYYLRGLSEIKSLKPVEFTITCDGRKFTEDIFFMVVMNGSSAGGFRKLGIQSSINDGLLDVIIVKEMNLRESLPLVIDVLQGRHDENKNVIYFQTPSLRIESPGNMVTDMDGEEGEPLPLEIGILPRRLRVNIPAQTEKSEEESEHGPEPGKETGEEPDTAVKHKMKNTAEFWMAAKHGTKDAAETEATTGHGTKGEAETEATTGHEIKGEIKATVGHGIEDAAEAEATAGYRTESVAERETADGCRLENAVEGEAVDKAAAADEWKGK